MNAEKHKALKLKWKYVSNAISEVIYRISERRIDCEVMYDDETYWCIKFSNDRMDLTELEKLTKAANASAEDILETYPSEGQKYIGSIGMGLSYKMLKLYMEINWENELITRDSLWLVGIADASEAASIIFIDVVRVNLNDLKSRQELIDHLSENAPVYGSLTDFCSEYVKKYKNELYWQFPILDEFHQGLYFVLVREGILSLPYDYIDKNDFEIFCPEDSILIDNIDSYIDDWNRFDKTLRDAMSDMKSYIKRKEMLYGE